jgi:hypothetical protein
MYYYGKFEIKDPREINYVSLYVNRLNNKKPNKKQSIGRVSDIFVDTSF